MSFDHSSAARKNQVQTTFQEKKMSERERERAHTHTHTEKKKKGQYNVTYVRLPSLPSVHNSEDGGGTKVFFLWT